MRVFGIVMTIIILLTCVGKTSFSADQRAEACKVLVQYMGDYQKLYATSGNKTDPNQVASLRSGVEHKLMDLGVQSEVFLALARYEFACRACYYLGWDSECTQIPHYTKNVVDLAACAY
jgi:hypothetical protein